VIKVLNTGENSGSSGGAAENSEGPESAEEQYELGNAYFQGNGREKNCYEAVKWWRLSLAPHI